ncbi:MAG: type IX secretion system plug protein domain-containing protein [Bacteroidota bacterium]|nr:type IX secretion system plug protein domain-containing protein [Bacteroidota bacterium]
MRIIKSHFFLIIVIFYSSNSQENLIKSIQLVDSNFENEKFIFNESEKIMVVFDELTNRIKNYYFEIDHYDYDWNLSELRKSEFLEGFDDIRITNYFKSRNTIQPYINYQFQIPNRNFKIKKSGNYMIKVKNDDGKYIFKRKFIFVRDVSLGSIEISKSRKINFQDSNQKLKVTINCKDCNFSSNSHIYKLIVFKNYDLHNYKVISSPTYKLPQKVIYDDIVFRGGTEFFNFDNSNILNTNIEIKNVELNKNYTTELRTDIIPPIYTYEPDINGKFIIKNISKNPQTESEYSNVVFSLKTKNLLNNNIYLVGNFNDYKTNKSSQLNFKNGLFQVTLLLKQGFYNYKYLIKDENKNYEMADFWETENTYTAILYEKRPDENYFKIKTIATNNSSNIVN